MVDRNGRPAGEGGVRRPGSRGPRAAAGRWLTRCQYFGIPAATPPPGAEDAAPLRASIKRLLQQMNLEDMARRNALESQWEDLVGQPLAANSRPGPVSRNVLTLFVRSPTWKFEIERHLGGPLLERIRRKLPGLEIRAVSVRIDPGRMPEPEAPGAARGARPPGGSPSG